ncbi:AAA family ATPase [Pseudomonas yamanorum]|uniref:AAA family ATPase n=1 Tax=Pseudomonas yamanorum TaxID=515393 RepID=UPI0015A0D9D2|nr:AAA family ATPase [Pseudomonas yamanorum]
MKKSCIEYFKIRKLHGHKDVNISFGDPYKILVSENGQGKTTILKIIDAALNCNIQKLRNINFESIEIKFSDLASPISISKSELEYDWESRAYKHVASRLSAEKFASVLEVISTESTQKQILSKVRDLVSDSKLYASNHSMRNIQSTSVSMMAVRELIEEKESLLLNMKQMEFFNSIRENFKYQTLYLPTYRRIEDLITTFNVEKDSPGHEYIRFGLLDVEEKLESIKKEILTSSNDSMSRINGEILTRLVNGLAVNDEDRSVITNNSELIELVLNRFGRSLSIADKGRIVELVRSKQEIKKKKNDTLIYFLSKMYSAFFEQREKDRALSKFSEICTNYFVNKEMTYDETTITVAITCLQSGSAIKFGDLSSGEKQIVSLFSRLILERGNDYFVLFDEPELSLSVEWQKRLMRDVIGSESCGMLLAMTHSPFIFSGLTNYTADLKSSFVLEAC